MLPLRCGAQNYEWGRPLAQSEVGQLARANGNAVDEAKPYAELWWVLDRGVKDTCAPSKDLDLDSCYHLLGMGTHPNCPAVVASTGQSLSAWLQAHPQTLGSKVQQRFGNDLPFLFKVLSVNKALSIQSHPDKKLAEQLHAQHPKLYPDPNHKPEMALAISNDFEALCSFAPLPAIVASLESQPELAGLVGQARVSDLKAAAAAQAEAEAAGSDGQAEDAVAKQALRAAFSALMTAPQAEVTQAVSSLVARIRAKQADPAAASVAAAGVGLGKKEQQAAGQGGSPRDAGPGHPDQSPGSQGQGQTGASSPQPLSDHEALALRLDAQYPGGDVGVLSAFFLNLVRLKDGEAIYLPANEPHAYLQGELVECMAASDNVIRAGLTPKFKHAEVLCASLTYETGRPEVLRGNGVPLVCSSGAAQLSVYRPPFEEFEVQAVQVQPGSQGVALPVNEGPLVVMVQRGSGRAAAAAAPQQQGEEAAAGLQSKVALQRGGVFYVPSGTSLHLSTEAAAEEPLKLWIAAANGTFFSLWDAVKGVAGEGPDEAAAQATEESKVPAAQAV